MKKFILNSITLLLVSASFGQTTKEILNYSTPKTGIDSVAEALADLALQNPEIKAAELNARSTEYTYRASKNSVWNNLSVAGNLNEYTVNNLFSGGTADPNNRNVFFPRYNVGMRLSLSDLITSPKIAKANYYKLQSELEGLKAAKAEFRKTVIAAYHDYALTQKLIALQDQVMQDQSVIYSKVEEKFNKGEISLETYTDASKVYNNEEVKRATLNRDLKVKEAGLEALLGMPLKDAFGHLRVMQQQQIPITK
ncbi:TolC family protein [Foetidibacter luteolus]|uniref:TolC family protein n=1 Tax=Foetidibacter luteolus TaxID=2608880 RepID=UPI00129BCC59|nr:TolC family protein [Foetidibacter luteolus]